MLTGLVSANALRVIDASDARALSVLLVGYVVHGEVPQMSDGAHRTNTSARSRALYGFLLSLHLHCSVRFQYSVRSPLLSICRLMIVRTIVLRAETDIMLTTIFSTGSWRAHSRILLLSRVVRPGSLRLH